MRALLRLFILSLFVQSLLFSRGWSQEDRRNDFIFSHNSHKAFAALQCSQCHQATMPQSAEAIVSFSDYYSLLRQQAGSVPGVRCGKHVVAKLGDSLLRTHLRLRDHEALVVLDSESVESDVLSLEKGDVILAVDGRTYGDALEFRNKMDQDPQAKWEVKLIREGKEISRTITAKDFGSPPKVYRIGVQVEPPNDALRSQLGLSKEEGLLVLEVVESSAAKAAGVQMHDVLTHIGETRLSTFENLKDSIQRSRGDDVELKLIRQGKPMTLKVKPTIEPEADFQARTLLMFRDLDTSSSEISYVPFNTVAPGIRWVLTPPVKPESVDSPQEKK